MRRYIKLYEVKESYQAEIDNKTLEFPNICLIDNEEQREIIYNSPLAPQIRYTTTDGEKLEFISDTFLYSNEWDDDLECFVMYMNNNFVETTYSNFGFNNITTLKTIEFIELDNITGVTQGFFGYCTNLEYVNLNGLKNITAINNGFFATCSNLKTVDMRQLTNITNIGDAAFTGCSNLKTIYFPNSHKKLTWVGNSFGNSTSLENIDLSIFSNLNYLPIAFLYNCTKLTSLDLSPFNKATYVNNDFLKGCTGLKSIDFSKLTNITDIYNNFLQNCIGLTSLDLSSMSKLRNISTGFLEGCHITSLKITFIPASNTFKVIQQLKELYVINEDNSFEQKFYLMFNDYDVQDDLKIYVHASQYEKYITVCEDYKKHFFAYSTPEARPQMRYTITETGDPETILTSVKSKVGATNITNDYYDDETSEYVIEFTDTMSSLNLNSVKNITSIKCLNMPNVKTINAAGFANMNDCTSLDLSGLTTLETIKDGFLYMGTPVSTLIFPESLKYLKTIEYGFLNNTGNTTAVACEEIILNDLQSLETIGAQFIYNVANLKKLTLTGIKNVKTVSNNFLFNNRLTEFNGKPDCIDLSEMTNLETIGTNFLGEVTISNIILPETSNITEIPASFMARCSNITSINLSMFDKVTTINESFLNGCSSLQSVDFSPMTQVSSVTTGFLNNCTSLTSVDLSMMPNFSSTSGSNLFNGSTNITCVKITSPFNLIIFPQLTELYIVNETQDFATTLNSYKNAFTFKDELKIYVSQAQYSSYINTCSEFTGKFFIYGDLCPKILYTTSDNQIISDDKTGLQDCMISHEYNEEKKKFIITLAKETSTFPAKTLYNCQTIRTIEFEDCQQITVINDKFLYWNQLDQINFDSLENVRYIGDDFLYMWVMGIFKLSSCDMSKMKNITYIGNNFLHLSTTTNIKYPDLSKLKEIKDNFGSNAQTSIDIDTAINVETIGDGFLKELELLKTVNLSSLRNVKTVGNEFLGDCYQLTYADLSNMEKLENVGEKFMRYCADTMKLYKVPDIHDSNSFYSYSSIKELYITAPELQTNLKTSIFKNNINTNLVIYVPESLVSEYEEYYQDTNIAGKFVSIS